MEFEWNDHDAEIGYHELFLFDDDGTRLEDMWLRDCSVPWMVEHDTKARICRPYAYEIGYCNGYSMHDSFDYDPGSEETWGYQGTPEHSLDDIKRKCEEYLAGLYIQAFDDAVATLETKKRRAEWFIKNGYRGCVE